MQGAETITWEQCQAVTSELLGRLQPLTEATIDSLSQGNGVYILAYAGTELGGSLWSDDQPKVVFVGKSKPQSPRHFKSGSTGTSTIRRSIAALLEAKLGLIPIPRSNDPTDNDRFDNYMLDAASEEKLTAWMRANFTVAFYQVAEVQADNWQKALIRYNIPMLNFQFNPENKYGAEIKVCRKRCAEAARKNERMAI